MKRLRSIIESMVNSSGYLSGWLVLLMIGLIFVEAFMRYALNRPPAVADEFSAYMLVAISFLGAAYTWKEKGHVRITALTSRLPARAAVWLRLVTLALVFLFVLALSLSSYSFVGTSFKFQMTSATWLRVPLQIPHMTVAIGFTIFLLVLMIDITKAIMKIKAGKSAEATR